MSMNKDKARRVIGIAMLAAGMLLFTACPREVGLGSAVDTQKPVITITTPEADSVINGDITIAGTVTDDLGVKSVTVTFSSTSQPSLASKSYQATVDSKNKTWTLTVNTKDVERGLIDSNYEITATAADTTNKTASASRSFQIDNTAPTVLITSPSLYGSEANMTKFCSQLEIKGEAYDASRIQSVQVYLCNAAGAVVAGPLTADGTNTWSAMFAPENLTALQDNQTYYFYAIATDASGNKNTGFYHKADIYSLPNGSNPFPSINDIGHLDQGTAASASCKLTAASLTSVRIETGAAAIASAVAQVAAHPATAKGYPNFSYQAQADAAILWTNLGDTTTSSIIGVNTAIFATIQPPTDNSAIKLDTIEVKVRTRGTTGDGAWVTQTALTKQKVGESVNISVSPKSAEGQSLQEGTYEVALSCSTNSNAVISSNKDFQIQSDAPVVEESAIGSGSTAFAQGIISGNAGTITGLSGKFLRSNHDSIPLSNLSAGSFVISCKNSSGDTVSPDGGWYITTTGASNNGAIEYIETTGTWTLPIVPGTGAGQYPDDTYTFSISGTLGEAGTMITRVVVVDTEDPEINLVSPTADSCITISESGTGLTLQGSAMDAGSGILATYWCIDAATASHGEGDSGIATAAVLGDNAIPEAGRWYKFNTPTVYNLTPNMARSAYEEKDYKFFIITKDQAGYFSDVTVVPFFIDNAKPEITVTWPTELTRKNVTGMTITGSAYDTSGSLDKVYVSFDGSDAVEVQDVSTGTYASASQAASWTFPGSAVIADSAWTDGTHTLAFTVKDKAGRTSNVATNTFIIDNVAPTIIVANLADGAILSNMSPISGTAIDTLSGLKANGVTYSLDGGQTWLTDAENQSGAWTITLPTNSGEDEQRINIRAEDKAGNIHETGDIHFTIDKDDPQGSILVNQETDPSIDTFMTKDSFTLSGAANDAAQTTGRQAEKAKLTYSKDGGSAVTVFDSETGVNTSCWNKTAGTWSWSMPADFAEGFYTFTLTVIDKANKKVTATKSIRYDHTAPILTVNSPAENEPFATENIAMSGNVSDSGIGVDKIYYTLDDGDPTTSSTFILPIGNSWSKSVTFDEQGVHVLKIMAVDALGNMTGVQTVHFSRDDAPPLLEENSVTASGKTTNAAFSLAGKTYDTNGLDYITVSDGTTTWSSDVSATGAGTSAGISLTKVTSAPSSNNWSIDFAVGSANSSDSRYVADGTTTFTITVTDVAGKTTTVTRSVKVDTTKPSIEEPVLQNSLVKLDESAYNKLTVTASDSGTGLAGVWYKVLDAAASAPSFDSDDGWTALALTSSNDSNSTWTGNIDFSTDENKTEGNHKIYVAAKDTAGNRIRYGETAASTTPAATVVTVDKQKPVISVTGLTEAAAADVELTITIDDTNPDADALTIEVMTPAGVSLGYLDKTASTSNSWKVTVPFSESEDETDDYYADGLYQIVVNETDTRGRNAATVTHTIRKDTTAPEINTIDNPDTDKTGSDALYGSTFEFRGTAKDKSDSSACAGVAKILYAFTQSATAPAEDSSYTQLTVTDGTPWKITKYLEEGHSASAGSLSEGKWYLYVFAEDKSGNRTSTAAVREFDIDMKDPVLSVTAPADITKTEYTAAGTITISGTATDSNGIAQNASGKKYVTVKVGSADAVEAIVADNGTWSYTYTRTDANKDQNLSATVTVTDMAGKTASKNVPFYFDTQAPEITVTKPAEGEAIVVDSDNKYTISGIAADLGIGVDSEQATFVITDADDQTVASGSLNVSGASWSKSVDFTGKAEGVLTLKVSVKDKLNQSASLTKNFYYDKADPELRVATVSATGLTTKADFQLAGTAWDTNGLDCITVSDGTNTWTSAGVSPTVSLTNKTSDPGTAVADRNWHINFGVGSSESGIHVADGTTTFTITAKDVAGKTSTVTRTVTVDTTAPSISSVELDGSSAIPADKVFLDVSQYKMITVEAADPEPSEGVSGTGLKGLYYQVITGSTAPSFESDTDWTALALSGNTEDGTATVWTGNIDFSTDANKTEGAHRIYVAAKDTAGNRVVYGTAKTVTVDTKKPVVSVSGAKNAKAENVVLTITIDDTNPSKPGVKVLKPGDTTPVTIEPEGSGSTWTATLPFGTYTTDGIYTVTVTETDTRGRAADPVSYEVRRDTTPPTVAITNPETGKTGVNALLGSSYIFRGTATDNDGGTGLAKIKYAFEKTTVTTPTAWEEIVTSETEWTISKDINQGLAATAGTSNLYEGKWKLFILAEDKAGNVTAETTVREFDIDLADPVLTIKDITDLTKTTYTAAASFIVKAEASDTHGVASVKVAIDDAAAQSATLDSTEGVWKYTVNRTTGASGNADKLHNAVVTVTDKAGKTTEKKVPFYFDTQGPSVTVTTPADGKVVGAEGNSYSISGTVADVGIGVDPDQATFKIENVNKTGVEPITGDLTISGAAWEADAIDLGSSEGQLRLTVTIKDKLGKATEVSRDFYLDLNNPVINELSINASSKTINGNLTLAGTAWDTNELDCITITDGTTTWTSGETGFSLTKATEEPAANNWSKTIVAGNGEGQFADGTKTFTITAKDIANKTTTITRTITLDTSKPEISSVTLEGSDAIPADKVFLDESKYKKITVVASDTGTGLAGVYYQVVAGTASAPAFTADTGWTALALGSEGWTGNIDFSTDANKTEGAHKIYVAAKDNAGNRIRYGESSTSTTPTAKTVTVDKQKPSVAADVPADTGANEITFTVTITDTNPGVPVITVKNPDGDEITPNGVDNIEDSTVPANAGYKKYNVTVPFDDAEEEDDPYYADGEYTIIITETDTRGRVAEKEYRISKDTTAPTVAIGAPEGKTGLNALYGSSFLFRGTANDNTGGAGVAKILYAFTTGTTAPADAAYTELAASDGTWSFSKEMNEGLAAATGTDNLYEGKWKLYVRAVDKAGNKSAAVNTAFDIDMSDPTLDITEPSDISQTTYIGKSASKLTIKADPSDTYGVASVKVKIGSGTAQDATYNETEGVWKFDYNKATGASGNTDKVLTATVIATDKVGKTVEKKVPFCFDTQAPTVTVTSPASGAILGLEGNTINISGTVADTASGVAANAAGATYANANAKYIITKDGDAENGTEVSKGLLTVDGASWSASDVSFGTAQGTLVLTIYIKDNAGNQSKEEQTFYCDTDLPVITETEVGSNKITNTEFTFKGEASDTNGLKGNGTGAITITAVHGSDTDTRTVNVNSSGKWEAAYNTTASQLDDDTYYFTFTVTDVAGRTKSTTSTVTIDKVAPTLSKETDPSTQEEKNSFLTDSPTQITVGEATENWFNKEYLALKAVVSDNTNGSGIDMVEYAVIKNPAEAPSSWTGSSIVWNTMTGASGTYTANAQVAGGTDYICIRASDKAGNVTYGTAEKIKVDLSAPKITGVYTDADCTQGLTNNTYRTKKQNLVLYLKTSERASNSGSIAGIGIDTLTVTIEGNSVAATPVAGKADTYLLSIAENTLDGYLGTETAHIVSADISDKAGNTTSVTQLFTLQYDKTAPVVAFTTPSANATVNKTITVSGTVTEAQSLNDKVTLYLVKASGDVKLAEFTGNDRYSWSKTLETFTAPTASAPNPVYTATSGDLTLKVVAVDEAGNEAVNNTLTFTVDQSKDCPEITITNIDVGEDDEAMSADNRKWLIGSRKIYGSVTDDDGTISKLEMSINGGTDWTELTVNNGSFTTDIDEYEANGTAKEKDGDFTVLFRVTDSKNTVFASTETGTLTRPVIKGSDNNVSADNKLYLKIDTTNPTATAPKVSLTGTDVLDEDKWSTDILSQKIFSAALDGIESETGTSEFWIRQTAYDINGIDRVDVAIDSTKAADYHQATIVTKTENGETVPATTDDGSNIFTYKFDKTTIAGLSSGSHTMYIRVTDKAQMTQLVNATFSVDNTAPTAKVTSHSNNDRVKGSFFIAGSSQDAPKNDSANTLLYKVTETAATPTDWSTAATKTLEYKAHEVKGNLSEWHIYFDDDVNLEDGFTHDIQLKKYLVSIHPDYLTLDSSGKVVYSEGYTGIDHDPGDAYSGLTRMYIHFKVMDKCNNISYSSIPLMLDPQGDIPSVAITYPGVSAYGWYIKETVSGTEQISRLYTKSATPAVGTYAFSTIEGADKNDEENGIQITEIGSNTISTGTGGSKKTFTAYGGSSVQGGTIRVQGTAEDDKAIDTVFLQIDPTYDPSKGFQWKGLDTKLPDGSFLKDKYQVQEIKTGSGKYGIPAGTTGAWTFNLNANKEFNGQNNKNNYIAIRALVVDKDGANNTRLNISPETDIIVLTIDSDTPVIGASEDLLLYQFNVANPTIDDFSNPAKVTATMKYTDDMWLKGVWWFKCSIEDSNDITSITVDGKYPTASAVNPDTHQTYNPLVPSTASDPVFFGQATWHKWNDNAKGYYLMFKIGSDEEGFGTKTYAIEAYDGDQTPKSVFKTVSIKYDNQAPTLLSSTAVDKYNISKDVVQSNGFYTLGSAVMEDGSGNDKQSGFERLALYFVRRGTTNGDILYDTYHLKSAAANKLIVSNLTSSDSLFYDANDYLYWKKIQVTRDEGEPSKLTMAAADANVHAGGLLKIHGASYIIKTAETKADGKVVLTLNGTPSILSATEDAAVAMALIVDNTQSESGKHIGANGYYDQVNYDDGDGMMESVNIQNTTAYWEANIVSRNIPDGAIEIHYVAFDKAGNCAHGVVDDATVANNGPRLAGVKYGYDRNGDGNITDKELDEEWFAVDSDGNYKVNSLRTSYVLKKTLYDDNNEETGYDSIMKVKGALKVVPEIVGGNGALYYAWSVAKDGAASSYYSVNSTAFGAGVVGTDNSGTGNKTEITDAAAITLSVQDLLTAIDSMSDTDKTALAYERKQHFKFFIYDSTEGMHPETGTSQHADLEVITDLKLKDRTAPSATITPFYWKGNEDNSIRKVKQNKKVTLYGHIELSQDLPEAKFTDGNSNAQFDLDDKVSGAIVIEGTAKDDVLLSEIWMRIFSGASTTETERFGFEGAVTENGYHKIAAYVDATDEHGNIIGKQWQTYGDYDNKGWHSEIVGDDKFSVDGHETHWKLTLNTENLTGVKVINDLKVSVKVKDLGSPELVEGEITYPSKNSSTPGAVKTSNGTLTDMNQFDVVPYITKIGTSISESAGDEFARSALGRYSIRKGETVKIFGYNLDNSTTNATQVILGSINGNADGDLTLKNDTHGTDPISKRPYVAVKIDDFENTSGNTVSIDAACIKGYIKVKVGNSESLNNINTTDAIGDSVDEEGNLITTDDLEDDTYEFYAYNRMPNNKSNNRLTDDVRIWVWKMGAFVAGTNITSPMMKMDDAGNWYMSYGKGTNEMYVNKNGNSSTMRKVDYSYNKFHNTNVAFDASGRIWAVAMNTDRIANSSSRYVLYAPVTGSSMPDTASNDTGEYTMTSLTKFHLETAYNADNGSVYDINRVKNSKIVTKTIDNNTYVGIAYYDANNSISPVKVRFGNYGAAVFKSNVSFTYSNSIATYTLRNGNTFNTNATIKTGWLLNGNDTTDYSNKYVVVNNTYYKLTRTEYYASKNKNNIAYYYTISCPTTADLSSVNIYNSNTTSFQGGLSNTIKSAYNSYGNAVIVTMTESNDPDTTDSSAKGYHIVASKDTDKQGGTYAAVGIVPSSNGKNGYVGLVAWYDANAKQLAFSYNTDPDSLQVSGSVPENTVDQWKTHAIYIDEMYTGWYVEMVVDDAGHIHLAYYNSRSGDLKYAYLENYLDTTPTVTTVDSYLSVGTNINMTVRYENSKYVPYIYYYNASATQTPNSVRVAWQEKTGDGAVNDLFTENWEVMTIPSANIPVDATICGGTPKADAASYAGQVVLGYMTDSCYEKAVLLK